MNDEWLGEGLVWEWFGVCGGKNKEVRITRWKSPGLAPVDAVNMGCAGWGRDGRVCDEGGVVLVGV